MTRLCPASTAAALRHAARRAEQDALRALAHRAIRASALITLALLTIAATGTAVGGML
jgi:formate/nitrite transporter FocA (FNT family)